MFTVQVIFAKLEKLLAFGAEKVFNVISA